MERRCLIETKFQPNRSFQIRFDQNLDYFLGKWTRNEKWKWNGKFRSIKDDHPALKVDLDRSFPFIFRPFLPATFSLMEGPLVFCSTSIFKDITKAILKCLFSQRKNVIVKIFFYCRCNCKDLLLLRGIAICSLRTADVFPVVASKCVYSSQAMLSDVCSLNSMPSLRTRGIFIK